MFLHRFCNDLEISATLWNSNKHQKFDPIVELNPELHYIIGRLFERDILMTTSETEYFKFES